MKKLKSPVPALLFFYMHLSNIRGSYLHIQICKGLTVNSTNTSSYRCKATCWGYLFLLLITEVLILAQ